MVTYYSTLGLRKNATEIDIKRQYKKLAMKYHPNRNMGAKEAELKFKEVNKAYQILINPTTRATYDHIIAQKEKEWGGKKRQSQDTETKIIHTSTRYNTNIIIFVLIIMFVIYICILLFNKDGKDVENLENRPQTGEIKF